MKFLTLTLAILLAFSAQSQKVDWGKSFKQFEDIQDYLGEIGGTYYFLGSKENKRYVQPVSSDLVAGEPVQLPREYDEGRRNFERVVVMKNKIYLFNSRNDRPNKTKYLFAQELDPSSLEPVGSSQNIGLIKYQHINEAGEFEFALSQDLSRLAIRYDTPDKDKAEETFDVQLFDEYMSMTWEESCTVSTIHEYFVWEDFDVSNDGTVYLSNIRYDRRPGTGKAGAVIMHPFVSVLNGGDSGLNDIAMDFAGLMVNDLRLEVAKDGKAYVVGTSSYVSEKSASGMIFGQISDEGVVLGGVELGNENIFQCLSESSETGARRALAKKGVQPELRGLRMRDVQIKNNGSIVAAMEVVRKASDPVAGGPFAQASNLERSYYLRDIIVAEFTQAGLVNYSTVIPKRQHSVSEDNMFASFQMVLSGDDTYIFYNDHQSNLDKERSSDMFNLQNQQKCKPTMAHVDADGNLKRSYLILEGEEDFIIRPAASDQIGQRNEMIIYARERSARMMGQLKF